MILYNSMEMKLHSPNLMFLVEVAWLKIKITQKLSINVTFASSDLFAQLNYFDTFEFTPEKRNCSNIIFSQNFNEFEHFDLSDLIWPEWLVSEQYKAIWMRNMPPMLHQKRPFDFTSENSFNWNVLLHSLQFQNDAKWFSQTSFQKTCWYYWSECLYRILYSTNWHKR